MLLLLIYDELHRNGQRPNILPQLRTMISQMDYRICTEPDPRVPEAGDMLAIYLDEKDSNDHSI